MYLSQKRALYGTHHADFAVREDDACFHNAEKRLTFPNHNGYNRLPPERAGWGSVIGEGGWRVVTGSLESLPWGGRQTVPTGAVTLGGLCGEEDLLSGAPL